jgi:hypothetical protein
MANENMLRILLSGLDRLQLRLCDIDRKLDHVIFRLREEDPRVHTGKERR